MTLYIFNCDGFVATETGGLFSKGRRKLVFASASERLNSRISTLVGDKSPFSSDELPNNVLLVLQSEGLLSEYPKNNNLLSSIRKYGGYQIRQFKKNYMRDIPPHIFIPFLYMVCYLNVVAAWIFNRNSVLLLPTKHVSSIVRSWSWITRPSILVTIALLNILTILVFTFNEESQLTKFASLSRPEQVLSILVVAMFIIFHELSHAACAYHRSGSSGEIRLGRHFFVLPFLFAKMEQINTLGRFDKFAISSSGIILQIAASLFLHAAFGGNSVIASACEISIILALLNLLPVLQSDGYWMICDLIGHPLKLTTNWRTAKRSDIIYTASIFTVVCVGVGILAVVRNP